MSMRMKNSFNGQAQLPDGFQNGVCIPAWVYDITQSSISVPNDRAVALQRANRERLINDCHNVCFSVSWLQLER